MNDLMNDQNTGAEATDDISVVEDESTASNDESLFPRRISAKKNYRPFNALRSRELYETERSRQAFDNAS